MKIHFISDLHCDFTPYEHQLPECDVAIIAGDVGEHSLYLEEIIKNNPERQVVFVPGNHDYYGCSIKEKDLEFKNLETKFCNFKYLQNDWIEIDDVAIFGATLWSNLDAYKNAVWNFQLKRWYTTGINDCFNIKGWDTEEMINEFETAISSLKLFEEQCREKKKVIVTHFAPSLMSVAEKFKNETPFNSYWCNGLSDELVAKFDLWIHGHTHTSLDYEINHFSLPERSCRVMCNPKGYNKENLEFDPELIVEI